MNSLPAFYFLEPEPLIKAMVKTKKVHVHLGAWQGLPILAIGPRNGKIVGYQSNGKPIYAGSAQAQKLVALMQAKKTYTPVEADKALVEWLLALGLQGAVSEKLVHLSKQGAQLLQESFGLPAGALGGGKYGVDKGLLLQHLGEPLKPAEEHHTAWAAEQAAGEVDQDVFPPLSTLTEIPAGEYAGSHGNSLFVDKQGKKWVFKAANPTIARAEEAACRIGRLILGDLIPPAKYVKVKGKDGVLIQVLEGQVWQSSSGAHSDPQLEYLKKYKELVVQHEVVDWLISNHDSHAGNFLADGDQMKAIDKGQAWKWIGKDKLDPNYKGENPSYPIYQKFWTKVSQGDINPEGLVEAVAKAVNRAEKISSEQFKLLAAPYISVHAGNLDLNPEIQFQKMLSRLQNLRSDFEVFLGKQLGHPVTLPKLEAVAVKWDTPPEEEKPKEKEVPAEKPGELKVVDQIILPDSPPKLEETEKIPVVVKEKAGWPLTKKGPKTGVTVLDPGEPPPVGWPEGIGGPGLHLMADYKGEQYSLVVQESLFESGKPKFKVLYPDGKEETFNSLNAAGDSLYLFNQGMPLGMTATEKKKKGISLGSKVFQLNMFQKELAEAHGKADEPPAPAVVTVQELEAQKIVEPAQKKVSVMELLKGAPSGTAYTQTAIALPQEIKEWIAANPKMANLLPGWWPMLTPGYAVKVDAPVGAMVLTARVGKEGKPELWGWWEGVNGELQHAEYTGIDIENWEKYLELDKNDVLASIKQVYLTDATTAAAEASPPPGPPPAVELPKEAEVPADAPAYSAGPLAPGTVIKVKKKVPKYDKKQEVTLSVLANGKLLVEIPGQTAQTFQTLSAASDHVWVVQKGYENAEDYKAKNKINKVPSGGGWKFWGISPKAAPENPVPELVSGGGAAGGAVPAAAPAPVAVKEEAPAAPPVAAVAPEFDPLAALTGGQMSTPKSISKDDLEGYPVGTVVKTTYANTPQKYIKLEPGDGNWKMVVSPDWDKTIGINDAHDNIALEEIEMVSMPEAPKPVAAKLGKIIANWVDYHNLPIGTTAHLQGKTDGKLLTLKKVDADNWDVFSGMDHITTIHNAVMLQHLSDAVGAGKSWELKGWEEPATSVTETASTEDILSALEPSMTPVSPEVWGKLLKPEHEGDFWAEPIGTKITTDDQGVKALYTKVNNNQWTTLIEGKESNPVFANTAVLGLIKTEKILSWENPSAEKLVVSVPEKPVAEPIPEPDTATKDQVELIGKIKAQAKLGTSESWSEIVKHLIALPEGVALKTQVKSGEEYHYTKQADGIWKVKAIGLAGTTNVHNGFLASDFNGEKEKIVAFTPVGQPAVPEKPANVVTDFSALPAPVQQALKPLLTNLGEYKGKPQLDKPSGWADWVPPPGVVFSGKALNGETFYLVNGALGHTSNGNPNPKVQFALITEEGKIHAGGPAEDPIEALVDAVVGQGFGGATTLKEAAGLMGAKFPPGSNAQNLAGTTDNAVIEKPVEEMTPAEKATKVKVTLPLKDALKVHPGLQEGSLKIKKAKGSGMYICLDGVDGASTKLYAALSDMGVAPHIKNKGGIPKVNKQGAFVAVDSWILDQEVLVETTAFEAGSAKQTPSEPNWQTMPEAKKKSPSKAQKEAKQKAEAAKKKAAEIADWAKNHPAVSDKADLQVLSYFQKWFKLYGIPVGLIARMDGGSVILSHKTHQEKLEKLVGDIASKSPFVFESVPTPWGDGVKLSIGKLKDAIEQANGAPIGGMMTGPDGKQYPQGTTFQKKTTDYTVEDLLSQEPGFYKLKEHKGDPANLMLLKVSGNGVEQQAQMKAMIEKYGLEGPFPDPKLTDGSVIHAVFKKSLQKVAKTETTYTPTIPEQPEDFAQGSLPHVDTGNVWEEVGDGSGELATISGIKPGLFGHALRVGKPGQLRDFTIRFRKVKDTAGNIHYEFTGDLVDFNAKKAKLKSTTMDFGSTDGKIQKVMGTSMKLMDYDPETGVHTEKSDSGNGPDLKAYAGTTDNGSSVVVVPPSAQQDTMKNTFRVRIPESLDPVQELRAAIKQMGKNPDLVLAPIDEDSDRIFKKAMLVRGLLGAQGWNEDKFPPGSMHDEAWLDENIKAHGAQDQVAGLQVVKTFDNQISVVADDAKKFDKWSFAYVGASIEGTLLQLLQGSGWSSRKNRLLHGIWNGGQSSAADFQNGGSKGTFFRIAGEGSDMHSTYTCQIIVHPRVFRRTDWWRYNSDGYGNTSTHNKHGSNVANSPQRYAPYLSNSNEILFEGGVSAADIVAVVVNTEQERQQIISDMKKAGKAELNGKSIEDLIVLKHHNGVDLYDNAKKAAEALGIKKGE